MQVPIITKIPEISVSRFTFSLSKYLAKNIVKTPQLLNNIVAEAVLVIRMAIKYDKIAASRIIDQSNNFRKKLAVIWKLFGGAIISKVAEPNKTLKNIKLVVDTSLARVTNIGISPKPTEPARTSRLAKFCLFI